MRPGPRLPDPAISPPQHRRPSVVDARGGLTALAGSRARRFTARHRRWYWPITIVLTAVAGFGVRQRVGALDAERDDWGTSVTVWVATSDLHPGDPIAGNVRAMLIPRSVAPPTAVDTPTGTVRQPVDRGAPLTSADTAPRTDSLALVPPGWGAVAVVERVASGAAVGDRVGVISDGTTIVPDALVIETSGEVTRLAIPAQASGVVAAADAADDVTLIRWAASPD